MDEGGVGWRTVELATSWLFQEQSAWSNCVHFSTPPAGAYKLTCTWKYFNARLFGTDFMLYNFNIRMANKQAHRQEWAAKFQSRRRGARDWMLGYVKQTAGNIVALGIVGAVAFMTTLAAKCCCSTWRGSAFSKRAHSFTCSKFDNHLNWVLLQAVFNMYGVAIFKCLAASNL